MVHVIGVMPFVEMGAPSATQRRLRLLSNAPSVVAAIAAVFARLPLSLRTSLVKWAEPEMEPEALEATVGIVTGAVARAAFTMAWHEFHDLQSELGWLDVQHLAAAGRCALAMKRFDQEHVTVGP